MRTAANMLELRRNKVLELNLQGLNQTEISHKLKVNQSVISHDFFNPWLRPVMHS